LLHTKKGLKMEWQKRFSHQSLVKLWILWQKSLFVLSKKDILLLWFDLLRMIVDREKLKNLAVVKLSKFLGREKMFCTENLCEFTRAQLIHIFRTL